MSNEHPKDPNENPWTEAQQTFLRALEHGVLNSDHNFISQIDNGQSVLRPHEVARYMDGRRRHNEDKSEAKLWDEATEEYLTRLDGKDFPPDELEALNALTELRRLDRAAERDAAHERQEKFDQIVQNPETAQEPVTANKRSVAGRVIGSKVLGAIGAIRTGRGKETEQQPEADLTRAELDRLKRGFMKLPVFREAERSAVTGNFQEALHIIREHAPSSMVGSMERVLDEYTYAAGERSTVMGSFDEARRIITENASSPRRGEAMLGRLGLSSGTLRDEPSRRLSRKR